MEFYYRYSIVIILGFFYFCNGDLSSIVDTCCSVGTDWAENNDRCDNVYTAVPATIDTNKILMCESIIEVCCLKSKQKEMCIRGKTVAKEGGVCAVRDDVIAAVTFKECCQCCDLGLAIRQMGMSCESPSIGNPCDTQFRECCTGHTGDDDDDDSKDGDKVDPPVDNSDVDECSVFGGDQLCSHTCVNTIGSFRCECDRGYKLAQDARTCYRDDCQTGYAYNTLTGRCEDVDECVIGTHNCHDNHERCINRYGGFYCSCDDGFYRNRFKMSCQDVDECVIGTHNCHDNHERCINRYGGFYCSCDDGFYRNRFKMSCQDIDECARRMDTCTSSQRCENKVGSFACRRIIPCGTGWTLDEETQECVDQNECDLGTHNCGTGYECFNIEGSFRCNPRRCPEGSRFSSSTGKCERVNCPRGLRPGSTSHCVDINECEVAKPCADFQKCQNTYGSYQCLDEVTCRPGFKANSNDVCVDIDECTTGQHDCKGGAECINRPGSYICSCPSGYRRIGSICEDRNECQFGSVCPTNAQCENTPGSYRCLCDTGFEMNGNTQCRDVDECKASRCSQGCVNLEGSYTCTCNQGYKLLSDGRTCVDIDECNLYNGPGVCSGNCENTPGSYRCSCPNGWRIMGNQRSCQDVDECTEGLDRCGSSDDVMCFNTRGSHRCPRVSCPSGFSRSSLGPRRNSVRCKRLSFTCRQGDQECLNAPLSLSYNFLTFPTNVKIPTDLFSMSGPYASQKTFEWHLNATSVNPRLSTVTPADIRQFELKIGRNNAVVSLTDRLQGPQDIELMLTMQITDKYTGYTGHAISKIYFDVEVDSDSILCKKFCSPYDILCLHNETSSVSYHFFSLPSLPNLDRPTVLLNITAQGFILVPQMFLHIVSGNDEKLFDTVVHGEIAAFRLMRPVEGPREMMVMLRLENRSYIGNRLLSAHNAHLKLYVSGYKF